MQMNDYNTKDNFDLNEENEESFTNKNSVKNKKQDSTSIFKKTFFQNKKFKNNYFNQNIFFLK